MHLQYISLAVIYMPKMIFITSSPASFIHFLATIWPCNKGSKKADSVFSGMFVWSINSQKGRRVGCKCQTGKGGKLKVAQQLLCTKQILKHSEYFDQPEISEISYRRRMSSQNWNHMKNFWGPNEASIVWTYGHRKWTTTLQVSVHSFTNRINFSWTTLDYIFWIK